MHARPGDSPRAASINPMHTRKLGATFAPRPASINPMHARKQGTASALRAASSPSSAQMAAERATSGRPWALNWRLYRTSVLVLLFLVYTRVSRAMLSGFDCVWPAVQVDAATQRLLLRADVSQECLTPGVVAMSTTGLLAYTVGIPVATGMLLHRNRARLQRHSFKSVWGSLYDGYAVARGWHAWELVVLARKVLVAAVSVLLASDPFLASFAAVLAATAFLTAQLSVRPFTSSSVNLAESVSLTSSVLTPAFAILYWYSPDGPYAFVASTGVLTTNATVVLLFAALGWRVWRHDRARDRAKTALQ